MSSRQFVSVFPPEIGGGTFAFFLVLALVWGRAAGAAAGQDLPLSSLEEGLGEREVIAVVAPFREDEDSAARPLFITLAAGGGASRSPDPAAVGLK